MEFTLLKSRKVRADIRVMLIHFNYVIPEDRVHYFHLCRLYPSTSNISAMMGFLHMEGAQSHRPCAYCPVTGPGCKQEISYCFRECG